MSDSQSPNLVTRDLVYKKLTPIVDPDLGLSITDLGLIYDVRISPQRIEVDMTLTSMGCPAGEYLYDTVCQTLRKIDGIEDVVVNLVWDPPWSEERVAPEVRFALGLY
jgi:metal-sulfur cluster biosynthetic enzyme